MSSKYTKKRKAGRDEDTSAEGVAIRARREAEREGSESPPPAHHKKKRDASPEASGGGGDAESLSIAETNKLRASLGLAPLDVDDGKTEKEEFVPRDAPAEGVTVYNEDGIEIHHKVADNWAEKKKEDKVKERLEASKQKRIIQDRVLKAKKLADDEDTDATAWVTKMRAAEERAKTLDAMDADFGVSNLIEEEKEKAKRKKAREAIKKRRAEQEAASTAGLIIGHSKASFMGGKDQILVLEDKSVLDDNEDEVLVNPNMIDNEMHKKNAELKKKKDRYRPFDEAYDADGNARPAQLLAKYDEELEGGVRKTFRLDAQGEVDLEREEEEARRRALQEMAGKTLVSLDMDKHRVASEFYTEEEMVSFRKPKKDKKDRKERKKLGKMLKADDLKPLEDEGEKDLRSRRRGRHASDDYEEKKDGDVEMKQAKKEDGELEEDRERVDDGEGGTMKKGWKKATKGAVDIDALRRLAAMEDDESDDDDLMALGTGIIIDDEATDELSAQLDRARRLKMEQARPEAVDSEAVAKKTMLMVQQHGGGRVKKEDPDEEGGEAMEEEDSGPEDGVMCIDVTKEYCRNIGKLETYGITGNREDNIDLSLVEREAEKKKVKREEGVDEFESVQKWKRAQAEKERRKRAKEAPKKGDEKTSRGGWVDETDEDQMMRDMDEARDRIKEEEGSDDEEEDDGEYNNVLGDEADIRKGVGNMLKLASQKGYLTDPNAVRKTGESLEHLQNKRVTKLDNERHDIEDKYVKKLERMGTTGSGPARNFSEKDGYAPEIVLEYVDNKGRVMDPKDAFREMSWKFHGKRPGKKQIEKRTNRAEKKEMMKKTESWDTPLGTLNKQIKKQEQMQTPYLVLSSSSRQTELKKE